MPKKKTQKESTQRTIITLRSEPAAIAQFMDVDRIHSIIRSAENGNTRDLFTLYRDMIIADSHLQTEFSKRKLAVLGDQPVVMPWDKNMATDVFASNACDAMISNCMSWQDALIHLLDATIWPVAVVEKVFKARGIDGSSAPAQSGTAYELEKLVPVPHYLLDYSTGKMMINDVDPVSGSILSTMQEADPSRYIIHRGHLLSCPDNYGGPMRSIMFWWLLANMYREWWARFLDRYGSAFILAKFPKGDDDSRNVLRNALALSVKIGGLVVNDACHAELVHASTSSSGDAYDRFITLCQREKSKLILGQTLSAESQPTGLGSGVATMHEGVRQDIRMWDASSLANTLRQQLFSQFLTINGIRSNIPTLTFGAEAREDLKVKADLLWKLKLANLQPTKDAISKLSEDFGIELEIAPMFPGAQPTFMSGYPQ